MSRRASSAATLVVSAALASVSSCTPILARPLSNAPMNTCPCERFAPGPEAPARCSVGRCEISTAGNRPTFPFWIVVDVPETSFFAPSSTYVLYSDERGEPAFKKPISVATNTRCTPPLCLALGGLAFATGAYQVTRDASAVAGYPLNDGASIPVDVVYDPVGIDPQTPPFPNLPLDLSFSSPRLDVNGTAEFARALPYGAYRRILYPQPPFDRFFPPEVEDNQQIASSNFIDKFVLGTTKPLDDATGDSRVAEVKREDGLEGWRVWLVDLPTQRRISTLQTLTGTDATVRLNTVGEQRGPNGGLGDDVQVIVAPPESFAAVPRLVSGLFAGQGLKNLVYPAIPSPVTVAGVVAQPSDGAQLFGYSAHVSFESQSLATSTDPTQLLHYTTDLGTDDRGRFATVLPPGTYAVTVEPAEGTGFAKTRRLVVVDRTVTALTLQPPARTPVKGRVLLTDDRPLSEADVLATPRTPDTAQIARPRPGRTTTLEDGRFEIDLDSGAYVLTVIPKAGTGFPRVVIRPDVPVEAIELPDIRVPAPTPLAFTLRDPSPIGNPIVRAVVRIFARPAKGTDSTGVAPDPVEIGIAMTDPNGLVEILLAQEPR